MMGGITGVKAVAVMLTAPTINIISNRFGMDNKIAKSAVITIGLMGIVLLLDVALTVIKVFKDLGVN
jgi:hypothetical protein